MDTHNPALDPEGRHRADGPRLVERNAERVLALIPASQVERTRDAIEIRWGGEEGLIVLVTPEAFEVRLPTVEWTTDYAGPAESSRLWRRVRADKVSEQRLGDLLQGGLAARAREFRSCRHCKKSFPTEHRTGSVCHECASARDGIVF